jgi:hypothetical protein
MYEKSSCNSHTDRSQNFSSIDEIDASDQANTPPVEAQPSSPIPEIFRYL